MSHPKIIIASDKHPTLTDGTITPETLHQFKTAAANYFSRYDINELCQVKKLLSSFENPEIQAWMTRQQSRLQKLSFPQFINEISLEFLPDGWQEQYHAEILHSQMDVAKNDRCFKEWAAELETKNECLSDTPFFLDDALLLKVLKNGLTPSLKNRCIESDNEHDRIKWARIVTRISLTDIPPHSSAPLPSTFPTDNSKRNRETEDQISHDSKRHKLSNNDCQQNHQRVSSTSVSRSIKPPTRHVSVHHHSQCSSTTLMPTPPRLSTAASSSPVLVNSPLLLPQTNSTNETSSTDARHSIRMVKPAQTIVNEPELHPITAPAMKTELLSPTLNSNNNMPTTPHRSSRRTLDHSTHNHRHRSPTTHRDHERPRIASASFRNHDRRSRSSTRRYPPRLTDHEREIIVRHSGCTSCRRLHRSDACLSLPSGRCDELADPRLRVLEPRRGECTCGGTGERSSEGMSLYRRISPMKPYDARKLYTDDFGTAGMRAYDERVDDYYACGHRGERGSTWRSRR